MANSTDWYPVKLADRVAWHANFSVQATATGVARGLAAGVVTQIASDSTAVAACVNYIALVDAFRQAVTEFKDTVMQGLATAPMPPVPTVPAAIVVGGTAQAGIEARTRQYAAIVRAAAGYTQEVGELYGIVGPAPVPPTTPSLVATSLTQSQVSLRVIKAGYALLAIDGRRGGGDWEQIGVSQTAEYVDGRAPLVAGQPEVREYRTQGMQSNARVGTLSPIVSAVTVP